MTTPLTIHVTQEDIDRGIRRNCGECPIALAIKRAGAVSVDAEHGVISLGDAEHNRFRFHTPSDASKFMADFDKCLPVTPFTFTLSGSF